MAADEGAEEGCREVQVVSALSGEVLCRLELPSSCTVLEVKRRVQATQGMGVFRQRLVVWPAGPPAEDHEVLAALPGLRLQLVCLGYADADADEIRRLGRAADEGAAPEVERLLRLLLPPDCGEAASCITPLMRAAMGGHLEVVRLLCDAGAETDAANADGNTALKLASLLGHLEVARLLCEAGADKDKADAYGSTALMCASNTLHLEVVRLLCGAGADADKANKDGHTALTTASMFGHLEEVRLLCDTGADKEATNNRGTTALMCASTNGHLEVARLLCEAGADRDRANQDGHTALILASMFGHLEVEQLLCEAEARKDR